jgi:DNA-binding beta-propeller fold protein YncE
LRTHRHHRHKQNTDTKIVKTNEMNLEKLEVNRNTSMRPQEVLGRLARVCVVVTATAFLPARLVMADADEETQQILPFPTVVESTVPTNGDVNPYGVAFVPDGFPAGGLLNPGDLLVSNFNNSLNLQGTGTTIIKVAPDGRTSLFFQGTAPLGLSTGLAVLKNGFVLVANCPTTGGNTPMAEPGSLLIINQNGQLVNTIISPMIQGSWDFTVHDDGNKVKVFVSNVLTGTVSRLDLVLDGGSVVVKSAAVIASGYIHRPDPATFEVGPTGSAYDPLNDILYVASTGDNEVFAVRNAGEETKSNGTGQLIYQDPIHLHGALAMVLAPNGHLLVSNSDGINPDPNQPSEIVEFTVQGEFIGQLSVDPALGGAFGLNIVRVTDDLVRFAAVDDNANTITIWKLSIPENRSPWIGIRPRD